MTSTLPGLSRRRFLRCGVAGAAAIVLPGCDPQPQMPILSKITSPDRPIFLRFPELRKTQAWADLAMLPTPVHALGSSGRTWVKREDGLHPLYGGNKTRKLECLVGEWREQGVKRVVSIGGIGTNSGLAIALQAYLEAIECHLVTFTQPMTPSVANNLRAIQRLGARVEHYDSIEAAGLRFTLHPLHLHGDTCFVPGGAATPSAVLAYVNAALELHEQVLAKQLPMPDEICVAAGSGSTLAGLTLGCAIAGMPTRVIGVRVVPASLFAGMVALTDETVVNKQMRTAAALLGWQGVIPPARLIDAVGPGYGVPTDDARAAISHFKQAYGITLDSTYTGKAAAWLLQRELSTVPGNLLFWDTYNSRSLDALPVAKAQYELPASLGLIDSARK